MREQLKQYVDLLFAGAKDCEDIKQEILQNTLDRYDDLIAEGKVPEAAYRLAISGIGDVNEILGISFQRTDTNHAPTANTQPDSMDIPGNKRMRAIAIGLYIVSFIPLFLFSESGMATLGLCFTLTIVAVATVMIILGAKNEPETEEEKHEYLTPQQELKKSIAKLINVVALVLFFIISFLTGAWYITWLVFPIAGAVKGLVNAILDLKEAKDYEN